MASVSRLQLNLIENWYEESTSSPTSDTPTSRSMVGFTHSNRACQNYTHTEQTGRLPYTKEDYIQWDKTVTEARCKAKREERQKRDRVRREERERRCNYNRRVEYTLGELL